MRKYKTTMPKSGSWNFLIRVQSINQFGEIEWYQDVTARTVRGCVRLANKLIRGCCADPKDAIKSDLQLNPPANARLWTLDGRTAKHA